MAVGYLKVLIQQSPERREEDYEEPSHINQATDRDWKLFSSEYKPHELSHCVHPTC